MLEARCTSSGNKQKVRNFRKDCVLTLCVELNCENCKEFADHPFRFTHRVHCLLGLPNETTSSATEPWVSCSSDRPTSLTLSLNKQHVHTRYSYHIHTIFTHYVHWISVFKNQGLHHGNQRHQPFEIYWLKYLLACKWRYLSLGSFTLSKLSDVEITCLPEPNAAHWCK